MAGRRAILYPPRRQAPRKLPFWALVKLFGNFHVRLPTLQGLGSNPAARNLVFFSFCMILLIAACVQLRCGICTAGGYIRELLGPSG